MGGPVQSGSQKSFQIYIVKGWVNIHSEASDFDAAVFGVVHCWNGPEPGLHGRSFGAGLNMPLA